MASACILLDTCYTSYVKTTPPTMTNLPSLSPSLPTENQSKTLLAKLMASENISVEYSPKAQTASFNMETRVLILPIWKDLNSETLDMLIGHEVSHALHTPAGRDPLVNACNLIDAKNPNNAKSYLNVVEDARIERMIKTKFPGLRRSFASGYRDLLARDLFGIKNQTVSDLPLIDRINLQYKIGWIQNIPFTANELSLAQRVATTVSWTDVVKLSKEIYDLARQQKKDKQEQQEQDEASEAGQPTAGADGAESTESNSETGKGKEKSEDQGESTDSDAEGEGEQDADSDSDDTSNEGNSGKEDQEAKASDDAETGKSGKGEQQQDAQSQNNKTENTEDADTTPDASQTETAMKSGLDALRDSTLPEIYYADVPTPTDAFVVSLAEVSQALDSHFQYGRNIATTLYASWKRENSAAVQTLAQEFDRRQAADSHKRVSIAETGSIDPNRLHAYRIAEDIFLQNASVRDGKNHGIVVMLDMSGSMREVFHDTMIQLVTLGHFCKRVNVPFRFYGFTDHATEFSTKANWTDNSFGLEKNDTRLITLLQDGMRTVDFVRQCGNLLLASFRSVKDKHPSHIAYTTVMNKIGGTDGYQSVAPPPFFRLNNTPTNSALLGMATLLPAFKAAKRLQVVNLVVLTDGEATDSLTSYNYAKQCGGGAVGGREQSTLVWRDGTTRKTYATALRRHGYIHQHSSQEQTEVVLQLIKDRTGVNTVCLRLEGSSSGGSAVRTLMRRSLVVPGADLTSQKMDQDYAFVNAAGEKFQDAGWYALGKTQGFDQYIIVKSEYAHDHTSIDSVDMNSKSALRDLRKNFTKMMANKNNNRPLLAQIADILARAAH